jgi:ABC-2 type transport system ATP-binding protein
MTGAAPPAGPPPALRIRGLVKRYGGLAAVDRLNLDVPVGSVFGLIGPNGAGKTTTMQCVATLMVPDEGIISVFGRDPLRDPRAVRRVVGWMPDFFGLYDGLTCAEYLDFFADAFRVPTPERRERVADLLELVDLGHKADTDVAGLSRGMQQRLSLARTLVHDPELLVLDEPASGLDPRARVELREIVKELASRGKTILISSHILAELGELCDRIGIMEAGRMLAQGTPDEIRLRAQGSATIVARLLGGEDEAQRAVVVAARAGALQPRAQGDRLVAELLGGDEAAAHLLAALLAGGLRVVSYTEEHGGLERLFLDVTQGVVR